MSLERKKTRTPFFEKGLRLADVSARASLRLHGALRRFADSPFLDRRAAFGMLRLKCARRCLPAVPLPLSVDSPEALSASAAVPGARC